MRDVAAARAARMSVREWRAARRARFLPATARLGQTPSPPTVSLAGALVFVYARDGKLLVSVDLDDAEDFFGDPVPLEISVQGQVVWAAAPPPGRAGLSRPAAAASAGPVTPPLNGDHAPRPGAALVPPVSSAIMPWYGPGPDVTDQHAIDQVAYWLREPEWGVGMLEDIAAAVARTGRPDRDAGPGMVLLCDACLHELTGRAAACLKACRRGVGHHGTCVAEGSAVYPFCDRCGREGRLTGADADSVGLDPPQFWDRH